MARHTFGGDPCSFSKMFEQMLNHLYLTFFNKILGTSIQQWIPHHLQTCCCLIHNSLSDGAIWEAEYLNGETFCIFGFMDNLALPATCPGNSVSRRQNFSQDIQCAFYSGYLQCHSAVFNTELHQNDNGAQNMSGLNDYLDELLAGFLVGGLFPCLYFDGLFWVLATILPCFLNPSP